MFPGENHLANTSGLLAGGQQPSETDSNGHPAFPGPSENTMSIISSTEIHSGCSDSSNNSEYLGS